MSYRATPPPPPPPPPAIYDYRPRGRLAAITLFVFVAALGVLFFFLGMRAARGVTVSCTRSSARGGTCTVDDAYPFGIHARKLLLLSEIHGARVDRVTQKGGVSYHLVIETLQEDVTASGGEGPGVNDLCDRFNRFLADPNEPRLELHPTRATPQLVYVFAAIGALFLVIATMSLQRTRVVFDWGPRRLTVTRYRWPLWPSQTEYPVASIACFAARQRGRGRRVVHLVDLELRDGEAISLSGLSATSFERADRAAADLNLLLATRKELAP